MPCWNSPRDPRLRPARPRFTGSGPGLRYLGAGGSDLHAERRAESGEHVRPELVSNEHVRYSSGMAPGAPRPPVSRRERPAKPALTRAGIVAAAVRVMPGRRAGTGSPCGAWPRSWTPARRRSTSTCGTPPSCTRPCWRTCSLTFDLNPGHGGGRLAGAADPRSCGSYASILFAYPGLAQSVLVTQAVRLAYLSLADGILALLQRRRGDPRAGAAWAVDMLLHFATSTAAEQERPPPGDRRRG